MKYYYYIETVIKVDDSANYKEIVSKMRDKCKSNYIMIEDIHKCDIEDYIKYLEVLCDKKNKIIDQHEKVITRLKKDLNLNLPF